MTWVSVLIYDSSFFRTLMYFLGLLILRIGGWRVVGELPRDKKYVAIAAPHTSNWDFPLFMALVGYKKMRIRFLGKHTLFKGFFGRLFYWLGGIPVNRSSPLVSDVIDQAIQVFKETDELILGIAPEGTRSNVPKWKSGFYRIAVAVNVPIAQAYIDSRKKEIGFGPMFLPTGDQESDLAVIRQFYADKTGVRVTKASD